MKSLRDLNEKREDILARGKAILDNIAGEDGIEVRSLNVEEADILREYREEVRSLDIEIEAEKNKRKNNNNIVEVRSSTNNKGENKMVEKKEEIRSLDMYIRGNQATEEYRDLVASIAAGNAVASTPANGGVTIPKQVATDVIAKLGEQAPVFGLSRQLPSTTGVLTVPRQGSLEASSFTGELENLSQLKPQFETVDLTQKRVGAFIQLSDQILNDSAVDLVSYSVDYLAQSLGRALEKNILVGLPKGFSPVIGHIAPENEVTFANVAAPTVTEIIDLTNALNPEYLAGAVFVVSRNVYNAMSKMADGDGQLLFFRNQTAFAGHPTFAGFPVYVSDSLTGAASEVVFGNFGRGYDVMVKEGIALKTVADDTTQVLAGGKLLAITGYMDGAVVDPYAFATAKKA